MALKDLALAADGDLLINESGDFEIINAVRQGVQIRLRWIKGEWGSRGREFDSRHSDHKSNDFTLEIVGFFCL